jgi:hypothetical protein
MEVDEGEEATVDIPTRFQQQLLLPSNRPSPAQPDSSSRPKPGRSRSAMPGEVRQDQQPENIPVAVTQRCETCKSDRQKVSKTCKGKSLLDDFLLILLPVYAQRCASGQL